MHSSYQRLSNILSHASTAFFAMLALVAVTSYLTLPDPGPARVEIKNLQVYKEYKTHGSEVGFLRFDIDANLKPLFTWNTKQVFAYLIAEYDEPVPGQTLNASHEHVIWDRIVRRESDGHLRISDGKTKYHVRPLARSFGAALPMRLRLMYNVMPWVGLLSSGEAAVTDEPVDWPEAKRIA